ncbi:MAG: chemotaxis protein CheW [Gammaproteobacteria bacterium]|nr:chemotaxis protein CheW [Gammaproteobacteria bacterium]
MESAARDKLVSQALEDDAADDAKKYLSFTVDNDSYAFDALSIKEIIEYANVTRIPMVPDFVRGVTNLRGSVVPVIDLSARMSKPSSPVTKRTCIIIVEVASDEEKITVGVVIDAINEVFNLRENDIEAAPSFGAGIRADFISGMGKINGRFVILLNIERVLAIEELAELIGKSSKHFERKLSSKMKSDAEEKMRQSAQERQTDASE